MLHPTCAACVLLLLLMLLYCCCFCHPPLQVDPLGNVVLDSGADHSPERRAAFNIALSHFGAISVREAPQPPNAAPDAQPGWNVSEGHRLQRFADGMTIPCRGPLTANRAALLLAAYGELGWAVEGPGALSTPRVTQLSNLVPGIAPCLAAS